MRKVYLTRTSFVLDVLHCLSTRPRTILDVGFVGAYPEASVHYKIVDSLGKGDRLIGIDVDRGRLEHFLSNPKTRELQRTRDLHYMIGSIFQTGLPDSGIDAILMLEVFEHLWSPYAVFDELKRVLKPGGSLIMTYPNPISSRKFVKFLLQKDLVDRSYIKTFMGTPDHKVFPFPVCLANYLNEIGFQTQSIEFIKFAFKSSLLNTLFLRVEMTRKFASYIGLWATTVPRPAPSPRGPASV